MAKGSMPMSPKNKKLAGMYGDKNKITRGDVITAAKASGSKMAKGANMKAKKK